MKPAFVLAEEEGEEVQTPAAIRKISLAPALDVAASIGAFVALQLMAAFLAAIISIQGGFGIPT